MGTVYPSTEIKLNPLDPCPCESGKLLVKCCWRNGSLRPRSALHGLSRPKTGLSHPPCYAAPLADCTADKSSEHFISKSILDMMNRIGPGFSVTGFPWQREEKLKVPPKGLASNILCRRHNSALAPLDSVALRFFRASVQAYNRASIKINADTVFLCNGHDFERWILKMLCGAAFSGNVMAQGQALRGWSPELRWLRILFGQESFPRGWGLYVLAETGTTKSFPNGVVFAPLFDHQRVIAGAKIQLTTIEFMLSMTTPPEQPKGTIFEHALYRPLGIQMGTGQDGAKFLFGWDSWGSNKIVTYYLHPRVPDEAELV